MRKRMYVCDGNIPDCPKSYCAFNGTGDCMHTQDRKHARYDAPREWDIVYTGSRAILVEKVRDA